MTASSQTLACPLLDLQTNVGFSLNDVQNPLQTSTRSPVGTDFRDFFNCSYNLLPMPVYPTDPCRMLPLALHFPGDFGYLIDRPSSSLWTSSTCLILWYSWNSHFNSFSWENTRALPRQYHLVTRSQIDSSRHYLLDPTSSVWILCDHAGEASILVDELTKAVVPFVPWRTPNPGEMDDRRIPELSNNILYI